MTPNVRVSSHSQNPGIVPLNGRKKPRSRAYSATSLVSLAALATSCMVATAHAQATSYAEATAPETGQPLPGTSVEAPGTKLSFAYGVGLTTNYLSKGLTQTENGPALQPWLEVGYSIGYFGLWASNVKFGGVEDTELDVSLGIRPEFGPVSFDLGFAQYLYEKDKNDYGEAYLFGKYTFPDESSVKFQYYHEVYADKDWLYIGGTYPKLPWGLKLSGGIGTDFGTNNFGEDSVAADIGISGDIGSNMSYDFRASDSSIEDARFVATISIFN